jgi:hypothetical protein
MVAMWAKTQEIGFSIQFTFKAVTIRHSHLHPLFQLNTHLAILYLINKLNEKIFDSTGKSISELYYESDINIKQSEGD